MTTKTDDAAPANIPGATVTIPFVPDTQQRLLGAMDSIGYIQKDGRTTFGSKYRYLSEKAVKEAVQAALIKAEVMPLSIEFEVLSDEWREVPAGGRIHNMVKLRCTITFDDGRVFHGLGAAADTNDKATMQAQTAAIREAWKNVFVIPSGDDPEEKTPDAETEPQRSRAKDAKITSEAEAPSVRTKEQADEIRALLVAGVMPMAAASAYLKDTWGCNPNTINCANAVSFIALLKKKRAEADVPVGEGGASS